MTTPGVKPNWALLAGLRFVLALLVVCGHLHILARLNTPLQILSDLNGTAAVMVFFAISGLSISHSISNEPRGYLKRRFWRIYPLFFFAVALAFVPWLIQDVVELPYFSAIPPSETNFFLSFLPIHAVLVPTLETNVPLWSIGMEECFYLTAPLILLLNRKQLLALMGLSLLALMAFPYRDLAPHWSKPACLIWSWLVGWMLYRERQNSLISTAMLAAMCAGFTMIPSTGRFGMFLIGAGMMIVIHQDSIPIPEKWKAACVYLGDLSFPIYVLHWPVLILTYQLTKSQSFVLHAAIITAASVIALHLIDKPLRKRGRVASRSVYGTADHKSSSIETSPATTMAESPAP